jgi:alkylation response protein AidB-like acyl-CoA dehydrogenase
MVANLTTQLSEIIPDRWNDSAISQVLEQAAAIANYSAAHASEIDHNGAFPAREFQLIAEAGLLSAPLQREWGGLGLGIDANVTGQLLLLLKQIGRGNLAVGRVYEGHVNALQLVQTFGSKAQIEKYAADARDHHQIFGVWNAEAADGVKILPLDRGRYRLEGSKTFASGSGYVERPFVNGVLPDGSWQMCIVPMEEVKTIADASWWQPSGMRATASYKVDFTGVELDSSALIGQPGDYYRQPWLSGGVVRFAAVQLGGAEALFEATCQYLRDCNRTSDPYCEARVAKMAIAIESGNLWLRGAAQQMLDYDPIFCGVPDLANDKAERLVAYANMVRTAIEEICLEVMQLTERTVGTRGLLPPNPIERIIRDLTLYLRQPAFDAAASSAGKYLLSQANNSWFDHA